ncbi:venom protease-like [Xylocopa sonorina]|uniref:venom protease-like n=1 Tax=Xylocopa sonorina TaxID=1818115 RepID=UPI00403AB64E
MLFTHLVLIGLSYQLVQMVSTQDELCTTPKREKGVCVSFEFCNPLTQMLAAQGAVASNYLKNSTCRYEGHVPIICCPRAKKITENKYGPLRPPHCGRSKNNIHDKIVNGVPSRPGAWPWMAALGYRTENNPSIPTFKCGGSLISIRHVLTAAHCAERDDLYMVRLRALTLRSKKDKESIDVNIEEKFINPGYNSISHSGDIAVLRLAEDITFTDYIRPICLPVEDSLRYRDFTGTLPFVAGWGRIYHHGPLSDVLLEVQVPVITNTLCRERYSRIKRLAINGGTLCAGYEEGRKDACQGDSGGPLMLPINMTFYEIGVTSTGRGCAWPQNPGIYARVTTFLDFIMSSLK